MRLFLLGIILSMNVPVIALANNENVRIVIIETSPLPVVIGIREAFSEELSLLLPHKNLDIEVHNAAGVEQNAHALVNAVIKHNPPDLLVSIATLATRAAYMSLVAADVPKLFMGVADPLAEGIVAEFGDCSTNNITGESHVLDAKVKLDMLDGLLSATQLTHPLTIGLVHSNYPSSNSSVDNLLAIEHQYKNITFVRVQTPYIEGEEGLAKMRKGIVKVLKENSAELDGYWLSTGPLLQADDLVEIIFNETQLLPVFAENINAVSDGALLGIVSDISSIGKSGALRAKRILNGEKASDIPITRMEKYTIAVNVSTAIALQLPVPSSYLKLAKSNVYH